MTLAWRMDELSDNDIIDLMWASATDFYRKPKPKRFTGLAAVLEEELRERHADDWEEFLYGHI